MLLLSDTYISRPWWLLGEWLHIAPCIWFAPLLPLIWWIQCCIYTVIYNQYKSSIDGKHLLGGTSGRHDKTVFRIAFAAGYMKEKQCRFMFDVLWWRIWRFVKGLPFQKLPVCRLHFYYVWYGAEKYAIVRACLMWTVRYDYRPYSNSRWYKIN